MRVYCLSAALCAAMAASAMAQVAAPATAPSAAIPPVAAAPLTSKEVRTLKAKIKSIDIEVSKELARFFRTMTPPAVNPNAAAADAVRSGRAYTARPISENHRLLAAERNEIAAKLLAAGEKIPDTYRPVQVPGPPQPSAAVRALTAPDPFKKFNGL